ncbi:hypothetical protein [Nocardia iowensis]|uniref:Uncharacterized protein n=1 Tax=Nocardia iowensis TaxID=204891 RepID=A0ABX8RXT8_NOCIO|nr:hypothetical protein [Nocardia iowensis]QXN94462.1 hypothetical protein KV110_16230 [Nocardia iowensis]
MLDADSVLGSDYQPVRDGKPDSDGIHVGSIISNLNTSTRVQAALVAERARHSVRGPVMSPRNPPIGRKDQLVGG